MFALRCVLCFTAVMSVITVNSCVKQNNSDLVFHGTVAAVSKTDEYSVAESYAGNDAVVEGYESYDDAFFALENGKADVVIADEFEAGKRMLEDDKLEIKAACTATADFCIYFSKNSALCSEFNEAVSYLVSNGVIEKIKESYINGTGYDAPFPEDEKGTLVLVTDASDAPYPFGFEDENGNIGGIDSDIAKEICSYLGYGLEIRNVAFDEMFSSLDEETADFVMSSSTPTEERLQYYSASDVYFKMRYEAIGY